MTGPDANEQERQRRETHEQAGQAQQRETKRQTREARQRAERERENRLRYEEEQRGNAGPVLPGIDPRELNRDRLLYLAGIALGLRLTTTGRAAEECREFGEMMVELLGHIVRRD